MARKTRIGKDIILQAALELLIEKGYQEINIKTLSQKIGCSTQPLVWHFGNMEGLRSELGKFALNYANEKLRPKSSGEQVFEDVGHAYVGMAFDEPNLFKYLYMSAYSGHVINGFNALVNEEDNSGLVGKAAEYLGISREKADLFCKNIVVYTHGLASYVASGLITATKQEVHTMMRQATKGFMMHIGAQLP